MNRDLVVGIVGAAILVAAMVGVFYYEKNNVAAPGIGTGTMTNETAPDVKGTTAVGATSDQLVHLNQSNIANVTFTLKWTAAMGKDTLKLTVAPPAGIGAGGGPTQSDTGSITLTVPVTQNATGGTLGMGDWKVSVQFVSASPGTPVTPPITPPVGTDASVSWTVSTTVQMKS